MPKENFNFIDVEPLLRSQLRMDELPPNQIRISKCSLYIPKWMLDDKNRKYKRYSLRIDPDNKILLIKPDAGGKIPFTRTTKSELTLPSIFRCKKLIVDLLGQGKEPRVFACKWNKKHKGFIVDFKSPLAGD